MKKFIGKKVEFIVDGFPAAFRATVVSDMRDRVLVKGEKDQFPRRIVKAKIVSFMPLEAVEGDNVNLLVLACENPTIGCRGVQYIKDGEGFKQNDFNAFMAPCGSRCESCRTGSKGELRTVDGETLQAMMSGMMFGEYPTEETK